MQKQPFDFESMFTASYQASRWARAAPSSPKGSEKSVSPESLAAKQHFTKSHAEQNKAFAEYKSANRTIAYQRMRLLGMRTRRWVTRHGISAWVLGLIVGSVTGFTLGMVLIAFGAGLTAILSGIGAGYVVCGGAMLGVFQGVDAGYDDAGIKVLIHKIEMSQSRQRVAFDVVMQKTAIVDKAAQQWKLAIQVEQSEAYKYRSETTRLLNIDRSRLEPHEFEWHISDIFKHLGFKTELMGKSGDQGVDVRACRGALRLAIQAKRYSASVGNSAVQEVVAGQAHYECNRCVVVTTSNFTPSAIALARSNRCLLIGREEIGHLIRGEIDL